MATTEMSRTIRDDHNRGRRLGRVGKRSALILLALIVLAVVAIVASTQLTARDARSPQADRHTVAQNDVISQAGISLGTA